MCTTLATSSPSISVFCSIPRLFLSRPVCSSTWFQDCHRQIVKLSHTWKWNRALEWSTFKRHCTAQNWYNSKTLLLPKQILLTFRINIRLLLHSQCFIKLDYHLTYDFKSTIIISHKCEWSHWVKTRHSTETLTDFFFGFLNVKVIFSGNEAGIRHHIPSVSSSRGLPICSTSLRASVMMFAPVWHTMPAISIENHRDPSK